MGDTPSKLNKFRGQSEHGLDSKGRLNIPARFRDVLLHTYEDDRVVITPPWEKCLRIYPLEEWSRLEAKLQEAARHDKAALDGWRYLVGGLTETKIDRNGRVLLPIGLRTKAQLSKEITLLGFVSYFEVWDKDMCMEEQSQIPDVCEGLAGLGFI